MLILLRTVESQESAIRNIVRSIILRPKHGSQSNKDDKRDIKLELVKLGRCQEWSFVLDSFQHLWQEFKLLVLLRYAARKTWQFQGSIDYLKLA